MKTYLHIPVALGLLLPAIPALALDATVRAFYTGEYTTNSERVPDDELEEWVHRPGASLSLGHDGAATSANANYQVTRRIHEKSRFDDETIATGSASVMWRAIPDRLNFFANNSRTDTTIDSRGPNVPDNRQTVDFSSVGSNLILDSFSNHTINLGYTYGITNSEETQTDSSRHTGTASYVVPLSPTRQVSLQGSYSDVNFDDEFSPDYESQSGTLRYTSTTRILELGMSAGYQTTKRDISREDVDGFIGSFNALFNLTDVTSISFDASRSIQDNFDAGARGTTSIIDDLPDRTDTNEVFTNDRFSVGADTTLGSNQIGSSIYLSRRDYENEIEDEESRGVTFSISRSLNPSTTLSLDASREYREFEDTNRDETFSRARIRYSIDRWEALGLSFSVAYTERESDQASVEYEEWIGAVTISYILFDRS